MLEFLTGMIVGGVIGVFLAALCVVASKEDRP
jgi:gas vesicle protein